MKWGFVNLGVVLVVVCRVGCPLSIAFGDRSRVPQAVFRPGWWFVVSSIELLFVTGYAANWANSSI